MSSSRILILLSLCMILTFYGCDSQTKVTAEEEKLFVETYVKLARAVQEHSDDPEGLATAREAVLHQMSLDHERFAALAEKLEASPERWAVIWEQIVERLKEEAEKTQD